MLDTRHPDYINKLTLWNKYRYTAEGGDKFKTKYLKYFSTRESAVDFSIRSAISYVPAHAKAAIVEIKNAIYQRLNDVTRVGGPESYQNAIIGENGGVDLNGQKINAFLGTKVLYELLSLGKVGVFIDKPDAGIGLKSDSKYIHPYLYVYKVEDILSWNYDSNNQLTALLLRGKNYTYTDDLISGTEDCYRLFRLEDGKVKYTDYDKNNKASIPVTIDISKIPFVIFELSQSLLTDVADYQISLMNLASSDMNYALKGNFPFYTEQFDAAADFAQMRQAEEADDKEGTSGAAQVSGLKTDIGVSHGRRYPLGTERPGFISPSSEPLKASMDKQKQLKQEIRQLINLAVSNLEPVRASQQSKDYDNRGLEAGLSTIGMCLEHGENQIAEVWSQYERGEAAKVSYPISYSLKTDAERMEEAKSYLDILKYVPSTTFQKVVSKKVIKTLIGHMTDAEMLAKAYKEIDDANVITIDPETIRADHEAGLVSTATASKYRGYADGETEQAAIDHAERAARIAVAQSKAIKNPAERGVTDLDVKEKQ